MQAHAVSPTDAPISVIPLGLLVCSSLGLFFFAVSWAAGGNSFFESLYGYYTLGTLIAGFVAGFVGKTALDRRQQLA